MKMEFISAEEFLKQPKEIQKVFIEWWKPSIGDLYIDKGYNEEFDDTEGILVFEEFEDDDTKYELCAYGRGTFSFKHQCVPLLAEGQLRKFIEDKSKCKNIEISGDIETGQYYADFYEEIYSGIEIDTIENLGTDKFKAYWTLALIFAKECVRECL
jgi:hypothetical protein